MSEDKYADDDLSALVQAAFDKYIISKMDDLFDKYIPIIDQRIVKRINGNGYTPELNSYFHDRVKDIVETTVGNYLRVGGGRDRIDCVVLNYVEKKLEEHIEQQVQYRLNRLMEKMKKSFDALGAV